MPIGVQKLCCMDNGKPAAAYILAVPIENIGLFFLQTLGVYPLTFGGYPGHLVARCCTIGSILHLQLDLLLDGRFLLFHLLDLGGNRENALWTFNVFQLNGEEKQRELQKFECSEELPPYWDAIKYFLTQGD